MVLDFVGVAGGGEPALARRYLFGPAVDQVLAQENVAAEPASAGRVLWQLADHLGTTGDVVDSQGFFVVHFAYDSFGRLTSGAENAVTRYLYTGREWDAAAELQYNRARWYDPAAQRWIRLDPLGYAAGDANLNRYVGNAPTNATDPSGEIWSWAAAGIGAVTGAVVGGVVQVGMSAVMHGRLPTRGELAGSIVSGAVSGAAAGAVAGALTGDPTALAVGAAVTVGLGAAGGAAGSVVRQSIDSYESTGRVRIDGRSVVSEAALGGAGAAIGLGVGSALTSTTVRSGGVAVATTGRTLVQPAVVASSARMSAAAAGASSAAGTVIFATAIRTTNPTGTGHATTLQHLPDGFVTSIWRDNAILERMFLLTIKDSRSLIPHTMQVSLLPCEARPSLTLLSSGTQQSNSRKPFNRIQPYDRTSLKNSLMQSLKVPSEFLAIHGTIIRMVYGSSLSMPKRTGSPDIREAGK